MCWLIASFGVSWYSVLLAGMMAGEIEGKRGRLGEVAIQSAPSMSCVFNPGWSSLQKSEIVGLPWLAAQKKRLGVGMRLQFPPPQDAWHHALCSKLCDTANQIGVDDDDSGLRQTPSNNKVFILADHSSPPWSAQRCPRTGGYTTCYIGNILERTTRLTTVIQAVYRVHVPPITRRFSTDLAGHFIAEPTVSSVGIGPTSNLGDK